MRKRTYIHKSLIIVYALSSQNILSQVSHAELKIAHSRTYIACAYCPCNMFLTCEI
jgi:hypothetical protein